MGHSLGVPSALDYIEQSEQSITALISVSGFYRSYGFEPNQYFMEEKNIDINKASKKIGTSYVICSDNDPYVTQKELLGLANALDVNPIIITEGGHINQTAGFNKLPEVMNIINSI